MGAGEMALQNALVLLFPNSGSFLSSPQQKRTFVPVIRMECRSHLSSSNLRALSLLVCFVIMFSGF